MRPSWFQSSAQLCRPRSSSGNGWEKRHDISGGEGGIDPVEVAHVFSVDEYIQVTPDFTGFVTEIPIQERFATLQLVEQRSYGAGGHGQLRGAPAVFPQLTENMDLDVWCGLHHGDETYRNPFDPQKHFRRAESKTWV
jgi:hypothetical protein